ncbi:ArsR/SmtB family transcription factor [Halostagnicola kamekurae]|nr:winged helix-turn-helix domain-containing protein [Halostagnicola kamekurae]
MIELDELLTVLAKAYTNDILAALDKGPIPAREIAEISGASRPTVYRRLNQLEAVGAVETTMSMPSNGQQRKEFRLVIEELEFSPVSDRGVVEDVDFVASN